MRITSLQPHARDSKRVHLHVGGAFRMTVALELVLELRLRVGDEVSDEQLQSLEDRNQRWRAKDAALNLLSFRARSEDELRRRLAGKGFSDEIAGECVAELAQGGLVDDASFAESFLRDRLRFRPRGSQLLLHELRTRGVNVDVARATLDEVLEQESVSETQLARHAASKWSRRDSETALRARRRLYSFLARRGFSPDAIQEVIAEVIP
jgi:regulatory protein